MKFTIPADALADAAMYVSKSISQRPPNPILSGILIDAVESTLRLSGFDFEKSSRATVSAIVDEPGHVLLSARMFTDIARKFKSKTLTVEVDGTRANITVGSAKYTMTAMPYADFPALPQLPEPAGTLDAEQFTAAISEVAGAASTDPSIAMLMCVELTAENGELFLRATDRYRLAEASLPWSGDDFHAIIPAPWLSDVAKNIAGETQLLISDTMVGVRSGNRATTSLITGGDYPKIRSLFPDQIPITVTVDRAELLDIVGRVSLVAERNTPVRLTITDGQIIVDAGTGENAQGHEVLAAELDGDPITVAYNPGYLQWTLNTMPGNTVQLGFVTSPKPTLFTPPGSDNPKHLLMPVRLPEK
ncbi:DNA polymerase III subunit beta [Arthrobacter cryoconiti]|uniref:Beta sliding clamp n=1 Tax=Arthrobacter cryoconiti TaxID=748907 RepID=A0ABV8QY56_9MICC|nr:DNA polymerase III subunit beta [Arthrobacter cryoconiti]MCC9068833.1 DNA polymerase III subunit beta [Arthrobacter cryoconiti]